MTIDRRDGASSDFGTISRSVSLPPWTASEVGPDPVSPWLRWHCPVCRSPLSQTDDCARCPACNLTFPKLGGIWRFLPDARARGYDEFLHQYAAVRLAEGWGADDDEYYRALPDVVKTDAQVAIWRIRAVNFRTLLDFVNQLRDCRGGALRVLDLGAGNCWLAHRLARLGHDVVAVDISLNARDGLGAKGHYGCNENSANSPRFTVVQADFDDLPIPDGCFDLAVFNGSLHYSADCDVTLREALRVLRDDGSLVVMDSPVFRHSSSGDRMVQRRQAQFGERYGFSGGELESEGYLTNDRMRSLARLGLYWRRIDLASPAYRAARRVVAWLRGQDDRATFPLFVGSRARRDQSEWLLSRTPLARGRRSLGRALLRWQYQLFGRRRLGRMVVEQVAGRPILVLPHVFNPKLFRSGAFLAESLNAALIPTASTVLDLGTGSGVAAVVAAEWARRVIAVDINPAAVRCARLNALLNHVEGEVDVREGDLFAPVADERFDVVLFNPPYYRGAPRDSFDRAWRSVDVVDRFADGLAEKLTPTGQALVALSTDGDATTFLEVFRRRGIAIEVAARKHHLSETFTLYRLRCRG